MDLTVLTHLLNGLLMVAMPVGLGIYLTRHFRLGWRIWFIGAATFILAQVGHIPFNQGLTQLFQQHILPSPPVEWKLPFNAVVLELSANLWEELARYSAYRWWTKDARTWRKGVLMGAGHGGIEAIVFGTLALYSFAQILALRGQDITSLLGNQLTAAQIQALQAQLSAYWSAPWTATLLGAVERAFALTTQIALSVIVLQAFVRNQRRWLWLAIGWHALIDAVSVYASAKIGVYWTEAVIGLVALISLAIIILLYHPEQKPDSEDELPLYEIQTAEDLREIGWTEKDLEESRYNK
jgi:uncharacterized membrane protein YhfC